MLLLVVTHTYFFVIMLLECNANAINQTDIRIPEPPQEKPFFRSDPKKRIDYVLAFNRQPSSDDNLLKSISQSTSRTREIFKENLEKKYGFEIEVHESTQFKNNVTFYLLHLPFEELERHANRLQINKRIAQDYIVLVDQVFKSNSMSSLHAQLNDQEKEMLAQEICNVEEEMEKHEKETGNDFIDDIDQLNSKTEIPCFSSIKRCFEIKNEDLARLPSYFTTIYEANMRHLFHGVYNKDGSLNEDGFFTPAERSKIADYLIRECHYTQNNDPTSIDFGIERLMGTVGSVFTAAYPLHDCALKTENSTTIGNKQHMRRLLYDHWGRYRTMNKRQPLDHVRAYFGEKIGLYFAWLGFYTNSLMYATFWGLIPVLYGWITLGNSEVVKDYCENVTDTSGNAEYIKDRRMCPICDGESCGTMALEQSCIGAQFSWVFDNDLSLPYAVIMSLWAVLFLEFWKRRQFKLAYEWDLTDLDEDAEPVRPQYRAKAEAIGVERSNPVTLKKEKYVPMQKKIPAKLISWITIIVAILVVFIALISTIVYRLAVTGMLSKLEKFSNPTGIFVFLSPSIIASTTASLISVVCILVLNFFYDKLAIVLNDWEHHRTQAKYEEALTYKMFWFQFANYYSPLVYIAFLKSGFEGYPGNYTYFWGVRWQGCDSGGSIQMIITMVAKQTALNVVEIVLPIVMHWLKRTMNRTKAENGEKKQGLTRWEQDFNLEPVVSMTLFYEYLEMAIQYGFVTLFVTAFPLSPLFALLNNMVEIKIDATKFLKHRQRAVSMVATNIGAWERLLDIISNIAVVTNALVIALTSNQIKRMVYQWDNNNSLEGFVDFSMSEYKTECFQKAYNLTYYDSFTNSTRNYTSCYHYGHRQVQNLNQPCEYSTTQEHWKDLCVRFLFILIMEHAVIIAQRVIDGVIPDKSKKLESEIKRERHLTKIMSNCQKTLKDILDKPNVTSVVEKLKEDPRYDID